KAREYKLIHKLPKRNSVLKPERHRYGKTVKQTSESRSLFMHINKNFSKAAIVVLTCTQANLITSYARFNRHAMTFVREPSSLKRRRCLHLCLRRHFLICFF